MIGPKILGIAPPAGQILSDTLIVSDSTSSTYNSQTAYFFFLIKSLRYGEPEFSLPSRSYNLKAVFFAN